MRLFKTTALLLLIFIIHSGLLNAQEVTEYNYTVSSTSELWFEGTSTLHDWHCTAKDISGSFLVQPANESSATDLKPVSGKVSIPSMLIESGKGKMDNKMRDLLKAEEHPEIVFELTGSEFVQDAEAAAQMLLNASGFLTVAGVKKPIKMEVIGEQQPDGQMVYTGSTKLLMTDFDIKPPKMFLGTLRTGDEITVHVNLTLVPEKTEAILEN